MYKYNHTITLSKNQVLCITPIKSGDVVIPQYLLRFCPHLSSVLSRILPHSPHRNRRLFLICTICLLKRQEKLKEEMKSQLCT